MSERVYRYGLHAPHEGREMVFRQMRAAHKYRNALCEIERKRRESAREIFAKYGQSELASLERELAALEGQILEAVGTLKRQRVLTRSKVDTSLARERIRILRKAKRSKAVEVRAARAKLREDPRVVSALDGLDDEAGEWRRAARKASEVYWGTYLLVEDAAGQSAKKSPLYGKDGVTPNHTRYVSWTGDAQVSVQLQGGLRVEEATAGTDTQLRIHVPDERAWYAERRCDRRRASRTGELTMRVSSDERGKPVWAKWVLDMHRPLPEGGVIKWATVHTVRRGPHFEWFLTLTVTVPDPVFKPMNFETDRVVAVDIGWRVLGDELRVAAWRCGLPGESDAEIGELRLDALTMARLREPDAIRSGRDGRFDAARAKLGGWLALQEEVPDWLRVTTKAMAAWRSQKRLFALWIRWREARFDGDDTGYEELSSWAARDRHEWACEARRRVRALRRRRDVYRNFAARLADTYDGIVLEGKRKEPKVFDLRPLVERPMPEEQNAKAGEAAQEEAARSNRFLAALSELRTCLVRAFSSRGKWCRLIPATDTTRTCHVCGLVEDRKAAASVELTCSGCTSVWDQDDNADVILLQRFREDPGGAPELGSSRTPEKGGEIGKVRETRWARVARLRSEKLERRETARKRAS
jgi:hypothetical protein